MNMKKFLALLLTLVMCLSLAACGSSEEPGDADADSEDGVVSDSVTVTDQDGNVVSQEKIAELTEAYNAIAVPYNEIATAANENGWMEDEQTATELNAVGTTLGFIGAGLSEDITMLDGSDFDALIDSLVNELPDLLDELAERVSVPYEG